MPKCTAEQMEFGRRIVEANFEEGALSSDGGLMLLRQVDRRTGLSKAVADALHDPRNPFFITHELRDLVTQRLYALCCGYEECQAARDHRRLGARNKASLLKYQNIFCVKHPLIFAFYPASLAIHFRRLKMFRVFHASGLVLAVVAGLVAQPVLAETPDEILAIIHKEASATTGFQGFSAERGKIFFATRHASDWSCASCHTDNPAALGKHAKTGKVIEPLAPSANAERFTSLKKVAKWFKRNCNDVLDRVCTPQEQGDVLAYLLTVKK